MKKNTILFFIYLLAFGILAMASSKVLLWTAAIFIIMRSTLMTVNGLKNYAQEKDNPNATSKKIIRQIDMNVIAAGILGLACCIFIILLRNNLFF